MAERAVEHDALARQQVYSLDGGFDALGTGREHEATEQDGGDQTDQELAHGGEVDGSAALAGAASRWPAGRAERSVMMA